VCGWQVKLCDPLVTHESYLSALEVRHDKALYKSTFTYLLYFRDVAFIKRYANSRYITFTYFSTAVFVKFQLGGQSDYSVLVPDQKPVQGQDCPLPHSGCQVDIFGKLFSKS